MTQKQAKLQINPPAPLGANRLRYPDCFSYPATPVVCQVVILGILGLCLAEVFVSKVAMMLSSPHVG